MLLEGPTGVRSFPNSMTSRITQYIVFYHNYHLELNRNVYR